MNELQAVVVGAGGRMGKVLIQAIQAEPRLRLIGALDRADSPALGADAGLHAGTAEAGVTISVDPLPLFARADIVFDFTAPAATLAYAEIAAQARLVHVVGTTGLAPAELERLRAAARHARIVQSGNMSLGVNLLAGLVRRAAAALGEDFDVEIVEMHHRHKVDAPSGTALLLGEAAAAGRRVRLDYVSVRVRDGHTGPRPRGGIGFATLRGGSVVGEHRVILAGEGEVIELSHRAENRMIFARGALHAGLWAFDRKPGFYSMADVLGLD